MPFVAFFYDLRVNACAIVADAQREIVPIFERDLQTVTA